jgi:3-oxoacyl-[acyl-carrier-protein] synthase II
VKKLQRSRRVAITGMGAVTSLGNTLESIWKSVVGGRSGIRHIQQFDSHLFPISIAGEIDLQSARVPHLEERFQGAGRAAHFGVWAADRAWEQSKTATNAIDRSRAGVCIGASTFPVIEDRLDRLGDLLEENGWNRTRYLDLCRSRPHLLRQSDAASISTLLSNRLGFEGPSLTIQAACASATQAIGNAFHMIRDGQTDIMLTGGTDSMVSMMCVTGFTLLGSLSRRWSDPSKASRPFDRTRDGFVLAEGSAMLVLEDLDRAIERGAEIHAEILGYGSSCDAYRFTDVHPEGIGAARCMEAALRDAALEPREIEYINAHGTSTPLNDKIETLAIRRVFARHADRLAVSSTKSQLGHLLCAAGAIELVLSALALRHGLIPPTINLDNPDPECDLDYVPKTSRPADIRVAMSNSFGFGGQNGSIILRRWDHQTCSKTPRKEIAGPQRIAHRVLVTGIGVISPLARNAQEHFQRLCQGESAVSAVTSPELQGLPIGCEGRVKDFDRRGHIEHRMLRKILTNAACYAVAAAGQALQDAGVLSQPGILEKCGLWVGSLGLDQDFDKFADALRMSLTVNREFNFRSFVDYGMSLIDPLFLVKSLPNSGLCGTAIQFGLSGPNLNIMNGSISGLQAIASSADAIRNGKLDCALTGGYDSLLQLETAIGHLIDGTACLGRFAPAGSCRPFDAGCNGFPLGEGAAFVFLESEAHSRGRSASVYGEIGGSAQRHGATREVTWQTGADGLEAACRDLICNEGRRKQGVDVVFGDGLAHKQHDQVESEALARLQQDWPEIRYTSATASLAFCGVASSVFSFVHALLGLRNDVVPPMLNCENPISRCSQTFVRSLDHSSFNHALVWSSDRGVNHVAVLVDRYNQSQI